MTYIVVIDPIAEADMEEAGDWYEAREPGLQQAFLADLQSTIKLVSLNPFAFHPLKTRAPVRPALAKRFPYRVFFTVELDQCIFLECCTRPGTTGNGSGQFQSHNPSLCELVVLNV